MRTLVVCWILCAAAGLAHAGGFEIAEHGAAATGMVGAFTAKADDPSAIFYNPGGLAHQRGLQLYLGTTVISGRPSSTVQSGDFKTIALPTLYASYGFKHDIAIGIGTFTNFGLKVEWPRDWAGRFVVTSVELNTATINPTVSWRPIKEIAIGAGIDITPASADLTRGVDFLAGEGTARFRGNDWGVGGNIGMLVDIHPITAGIQWRSQYDLNFSDGSIHVSVPPELSQTVMDTRATATVPIPNLLMMGIGVKALRRMFWQVEVDWVQWSRFQELNLVSRNNPLMNVSIPQNWSNGATLRSGFEYSWDTLSVRGGLGFDWNPVPSNTLSPIIPDSNRWLVSGGVSTLFPYNLVGELAVMGVIFESRTSTNPAFQTEFSNWAVLTGLSLRYAPRTTSLR